MGGGRPPAGLDGEDDRADHQQCGENLPVADGRRALEMVKSQFISEAIGSETYWFSDASLGHDEDRASMFLLPAFDEFLISYKKDTPRFM
jgi:hypothetical protein